MAQFHCHRSNQRLIGHQNGRRCLGQRRRLAAVHLSGRVCVVLRRLHVAALDVSVVRQDVVLYDGVLGPSLPAMGSRNTTVRQCK